MRIFSYEELDELGEGLIRQYLGKEAERTCCVDIESTRPAFRPPGIYTSAGYPLISTKTAPNTTIPIAAPILRGCPRTSSVFVEVCYHRIAKKSSTGELPNGGNCAILFLTVKPTARYREGREHHGSGASSDAADPISGLSGKIRAGCPIEHSERPSQPG